MNIDNKPMSRIIKAAILTSPTRSIPISRVAIESLGRDETWNGVLLLENPMRWEYELRMSADYTKPNWRYLFRGGCE